MKLLGWRIFDGCFSHALRFYFRQRKLSPYCALHCISDVGAKYIHFYVVFSNSFGLDLTYSYEHDSDCVFVENPFLRLTHFSDRIVLKHTLSQLSGGF